MGSSSRPPDTPSSTAAAAAVNSTTTAANGSSFASPPKQLRDTKVSSSASVAAPQPRHHSPTPYLSSALPAHAVYARMGAPARPRDPHPPNTAIAGTTVAANLVAGSATHGRSSPGPQSSRLEGKPLASAVPPQPRHHHPDPCFPPARPNCGAYANPAKTNVSGCPPDPQSAATVATSSATTAATVADDSCSVAPPSPPREAKPPVSAAPPHPRHPYAVPHFPTTIPAFPVYSNPSKTQDPPQGINLSVANKGMRPRVTDQAVTAGNPGGGFQHRSGPALPSQIRPYGFQPLSESQQQMRAPQLHPSHISNIGSGASISAIAPIKGIPPSAPPKVASSPSLVFACNGHKDSRDQDTIVVVRDRKVKISSGASLYALCRSWMRNGCHEENQAQLGNGVKPLPRPLSVADAPLPKKRERDEEEGRGGGREGMEDVEGIDGLSPCELLQRHIMHARSIRAQLREERLGRIARYKTRLAMLLHPQAEHR